MSRGKLNIQRFTRTCQKIAKHIENEAQNVRDHSHEHDELGELLRAPCSLQIATTIENSEARCDQPEEILLYYRRQRKHPGIYHRQAGDDGEVGHAIADAYESLFRLLDPVRIRPQREVEQREDDQAGKQAPSQRGEIYSGHIRQCCAACVGARRGQTARTVKGVWLVVEAGGAVRSEGSQARTSCDWPNFVQQFVGPGRSRMLALIQSSSLDGPRSPSTLTSPTTAELGAEAPDTHTSHHTASP